MAAAAREAVPKHCCYCGSLDSSTWQCWGPHVVQRVENGVQPRRAPARPQRRAWRHAPRPLRARAVGRVLPALPEHAARMHAAPAGQHKYKSEPSLHNAELSSAQKRLFGPPQHTCRSTSSSGPLKYRLATRTLYSRPGW